LIIGVSSMNVFTFIDWTYEIHTTLMVSAFLIGYMTVMLLGIVTIVGIPFSLALLMLLNEITKYVSVLNKMQYMIIIYPFVCYWITYDELEVALNRHKTSYYV
jgi:hypothetical protein